MTKAVHNAAPRKGYYFARQVYGEVILEAKASANLEQVVYYEDELQVN
jgi:hypothetical protein